MNLAKTVCAWALARALYSHPAKLEIGRCFSWAAIFLLNFSGDKASHERVVGA